MTNSFVSTSNEGKGTENGNGEVSGGGVMGGPKVAAKKVSNVADSKKKWMRRI